MLGKLLKHELKATSRHFLLLYAAFFIVTLFNKICFEVTITNNKFWFTFQNIMILLYIIFCAAIFVITIILIINRFYKNLVCDEGYLMFTLPVTVSEHIFSKLLIAYLWFFLSTIIFLFSVCLIVCGHGLGEFFNVIFEFIMQSKNYYGNEIFVTMIVFLLVILIQGFYSILQIYLSIAVGQLVNKHRIITSLAVYFGINFIIQNIVCMFFLFSNLLEPVVSNILNSSDWLYSWIHYLKNLSLFQMIFDIIFSVAAFLVTNYILSKKLNLE